jgi:hypothetical protein
MHAATPVRSAVQSARCSGTQRESKAC